MPTPDQMDAFHKAYGQSGEGSYAGQRFVSNVGQPPSSGVPGTVYSDFPFRAPNLNQTIGAPGGRGGSMPQWDNRGQLGGGQQQGNLPFQSPFMPQQQQPRRLRRLQPILLRPRR